MSSTVYSLGTYVHVGGRKRAVTALLGTYIYWVLVYDGYGIERNIHDTIIWIVVEFN